MGIQVSSTTRSSRDQKEMASHQIILVSWTSWTRHPFSAHGWSSLECDQLGRQRGLYTCLALFFFWNSRSYYSAVKDIYKPCKILADLCSKKGFRRMQSRRGRVAYCHICSSADKGESTDSAWQQATSSKEGLHAQKIGWSMELTTGTKRLMTILASPLHDRTPCIQVRVGVIMQKSLWQNI